MVGLDAESDLRALGGAGLRCRPAGGPDGVFDLLPQAVVALHAAGLKVGEVMTRARRRGSSPLAAEQLAAAEAHAELLPKDLPPPALAAAGRGAPGVRGRRPSRARTVRQEVRPEAGW